MGNNKQIDTTIQTKTIYCLYARKSSESDERQTMSIDSQISEMTKIAERDNLHIKDILRESHSAKTSGTRPLFNELLHNLRIGKYNAILTWAPDRLSRNAGDLGMLVDLMDANRLVQIKTFSTIFSNNPNEKFLLMILCSQAKLENDNRGINIKRGMRACCERGWRPGSPPLGYLNTIYKGEKRIRIDKERSPFIIAIFNKIAHEKWNVINLKLWMDTQPFETRKGKKLTKSMIYQILREPFYYGEYIYSGIKYKGKHQPLILKELYDAVQMRLKPVIKTGSIGRDKSPFLGLLYCGSCGSKMTYQEKYRKRNNGTTKKNMYYRCSTYKNPYCHELYITLYDLYDQLADLISKNKEYLEVDERLRGEIMKFEKERYEIINQESPNRVKLRFSHQTFEEVESITIKHYIQYVLKHGDNDEKRELVERFKKKILIKERSLIIQ